MAKFAVIQLNDFVKINLEEFDEKYKSSELKKYIKCKKIIELKNYHNKNTKAEELTNISANKLNLFSRTMQSIDLDDMNEDFFNDRRTKIFIFSDDAISSAFSFEMLKDECKIKLIQLDESNIIKLINAIKVFHNSDDTINSLNNAKELCESLNCLESELDMNLTHCDAVDEIEDKI